jgi:hypothetical protein
VGFIVKSNHYNSNPPTTFPEASAAVRPATRSDPENGSITLPQHEAQVASGSRRTLLEAQTAASPCASQRQKVIQSP